MGLFQMDHIPIIPGLVRDNSIVLLEHMDGLGRYRMSMVDKGWNAYCKSKVIYNLDTNKKQERVVKDVDILSIIKYIHATQTFKIVELAFKYGNKELINVLVKCGECVNIMNSKKLYFDWGLDGACQNGDMKLVQLTIDNGATSWNWGLRGAAEGNNVAIAQMMIDRGASSFDWCLYYACFGGSMETAQLMIEKGADDWNYGLYGACSSNSNNAIKLVQMLIEKGASNWNQGLLNACLGGNMGIVQLMITYGATDWNGGLKSACFSKQSKMIHLMIENGATHCEHCNKSMRAHLG